MIKKTPLRGVCHVTSDGYARQSLHQAAAESHPEEDQEVGSSNIMASRASRKFALRAMASRV